MDVRELRIGNYVKLEDKEIYQIDSGHDLEELESFPKNSDYCKPIPLTEQWLIDFGYEFWQDVESNDYETFKRYVNYNFLGTSNHEVHIITSTYGGTSHVEYVTSIDQDERQHNGRMEFVHDLQNAVYKETGNELTLKTYKLIN